MESSNERILLLNIIINRQPQYNVAIKKLENYEWDFDGNPVLLGRSNFKMILSDYIQGNITANDLYEWAGFLELREDVDFIESDAIILSEILHELSNPELDGALTSDRAQEIVDKL